MEHKLIAFDTLRQSSEESLPVRPSNRALKVLFVGFQDQDNLGLRYLMSSAQASGHHVSIETFQDNAQSLVDRVIREQPDVIGFSLIFQYMTSRFARVVDTLRTAGVTAHISIGGHFPSFNYKNVLETVTGADSVVRFEGEATMVELLACIADKRQWQHAKGLAYRSDDGSVVANPLRAQVSDLDMLPEPDRTDIAYESSDLPTASILGSRGCPWNCDFCSIRPFYEAQEGKLRRLRSPKLIVDEMRALYHDRGVSTFLFQDDDFLATGTRARRWAGEIADCILASDISGRVVYKISCRSDEIREDILSTLKASGLTHVYMGVESGDEQGLKNMNKMIKPERHIQAGKTLRKLGLSFDFGFMLLDPWSDFRMVRSNIDFLEQFVGDGWAVASFCRMLPYAGTPTAKKLQQEGRLGGSDEEPDYQFLDAKLDVFYTWMLRTFHTRNFTDNGLCHILRSLIFESRLQRSDSVWILPSETRWLQYMAASANMCAITVLRGAVEHFERTPLSDLHPEKGYLSMLTDLEARQEEALTQQIMSFFLDPVRQQRRKTGSVMKGGFSRTWTAAESDWETRGVGVR